MRRLNRHIGAEVPWAALAVFLVSLGVTFAVNYALLESGQKTGALRTFPISVFWGPRLNQAGVPYLLPFVAVVGLLFWFRAPLNCWQTWLWGLAALVTGNLLQGGFDTAFLKPFYSSASERIADHYIQYYHDALKISDWQVWLGSFNQNQAELLVHTKTHPPFAVLIHYWLMLAPGSGLIWISASFVLLSSLTIAVVYVLMRILGLDTTRSAQFGLLYVLIPGVNIYSAASLDGLLAFPFGLVLLSFVLLYERGFGWTAVALFSCGFLLVNLLTFAGTFVLGAALLLAVHERVVHRRSGVGQVLAVGVAATAAVLGVCYVAWGYDHLESFFVASRLENPHGFLLFHSPLKYIMTRLENVFAIALFFGVPGVAVLLSRRKRRLDLREWRACGTSVALAGCVVLALMFLAGAYRTGETMRVCLFIYPYLLLLLRNISHRDLGALVLLTAAQTGIFQLGGGYYW